MALSPRFKHALESSGYTPLSLQSGTGTISMLTWYESVSLSNNKTDYLREIRIYYEMVPMVEQNRNIP